MNLLFQDITLLDEHFCIQEHYDLEVADGYIKQMGPTGSFTPQPGSQHYAGQHRLLLPGLYNIHTHLAMNLLRGYAENMKLQDWLFTKIFPFEAQLDSEAIYWGAMLGIAEAIRFGTVAATDMYMDVNAICQAATDSGFQINASLMAPVQKPENPTQEFPFYGAEAIRTQYHQSAQGRIRIDAAIHAEYTTEPEFVSQMAAYAQEHQLQMHLHLSETKLEHEECKQRRNGKTPAAYFASLGVFQVPTTAAHCVWIDEEDQAILKKYGVTIASCPVSNLKLASGICPATTSLAQGIRIGLGTDSVSSNNSLNLWEEIKLFALLHKNASGDPTAITPQEAIAAATYHGAQSQGRTNSGLLKPGYQADCIVLDIDQPHWYPRHNLFHNLIFSAQGSDVVLTMVQGNILYQDGQYTTIDIEKTIYEAEKQKDYVLQRLANANQS